MQISTTPDPRPLTDMPSPTVPSIRGTLSPTPTVETAGLAGDEGIPKTKPQPEAERPYARFATEAPPIKPGIPSDPKDPRHVMESLLADWGKTDSPHDYDGDGVVGIDDFLSLLASWPNEPQPASPAHVDPTTETAPDLGAPVEIDDTLPEAPPPTTEQLPAELGRVHEAYGRARAEHIARSILPALAETDPGDLREAINRSSLSAYQKGTILNRLAALHRGLMADLTG